MTGQALEDASTTGRAIAFGEQIGVFPKLGVPFPIVKIIVFGGLYSGPPTSTA